MSHSLADLLLAADSIYGYSDDDKRILRDMYRSQPQALRLALESDPLVMLRLTPGMGNLETENTSGTSQNCAGSTISSCPIPDHRRGSKNASNRK